MRKTKLVAISVIVYSALLSISVNAGPMSKTPPSAEQKAQVD